MKVTILDSHDINNIKSIQNTILIDKLKTYISHLHDYSEILVDDADIRSRLFWGRAESREPKNKHLI